MAAAEECGVRKEEKEWGNVREPSAILKNGSSRIDFAVCLQNSVNKTDGIKGFTAPFACAYSLTQHTDACVEALC